MGSVHSQDYEDQFSDNTEEEEEEEEEEEQEVEEEEGEDMSYESWKALVTRAMNLLQKT